MKNSSLAATGNNRTSLEFPKKHHYQRTVIIWPVLAFTWKSSSWWAAVLAVTQRRTRLKRPSMHALEKEMATLSSILAWRTPGMEDPGGLPSMGSHRVGHDWSNLAAAAAAEGIYRKIFLIRLVCIWPNWGISYCMHLCSECICLKKKKKRERERSSSLLILQLAVAKRTIGSNKKLP